jgi:hypothetical protein
MRFRCCGLVAAAMLENAWIATLVGARMIGNDLACVKTRKIEKRRE